MRNTSKFGFRLFLLCALATAGSGLLLAEIPGPASEHRVRSLKVWILSTMMADRGIGEWGFAAVVEADGNRILFDTGGRPDTVLQNARELGVRLDDIREVILSHNHADHTGGLLNLRKEISKVRPRALSRAHVGRGIFWSRPGPDKERNLVRVNQKAYQELGAGWVEHTGPEEIFPGVWLTGPVPRVHPEKNWSNLGKIRTPDGLREDTIPESQSLVIDTDRGLVVVSGCGHAGIVNTLEYARGRIRNAPIYAALGGFHLMAADDSHLQWTGEKLHQMGLQHFLGAHCTGIEAVYQLRRHAKLDRSRCVVGAVGSSFTLDAGIDPLMVAK